MTWAGVALDTCLLIDLEKGPDDEYFARIDIIARLRAAMSQGSVSLLLDHERFIINEYANLPADRLGQRFVNQAIKSGNLHHVSGSLTRAAHKALTEHGVDNDDFSFIGVAQAVNGIYATTEVKHLTEARRKLIADHCGVTVARFDELPALLSI